ncbi:site-specific integrase [Streptomyces sp. NPDC054864]
MIDEKYRTVAPVEDWLEAHRQLWSPNTVRGYATSLAQWWTFLEQRDETGRWGDLEVPAVAGFLSWLRNGRTVEHTLVEPEQAPEAETLEARLAALISFYRWQEAVFSVPVAGPAHARDAAPGPGPGPARAPQANRPDKLNRVQ